MEQKKSNLTYNLVHSTMIKSAAVSIGFNVATDLSSVNFLKECGGAIYQELSYKNLDPAAICVAIYRYIVDKLTADAITETKSKVEILGCGYNNGQFFINAKMNAQAAPIKKFISIVLASIFPTSYGKLYATIMKNNNLKPNKDAFIFHVNKINASLNKSIDIVIIAPSRFDKDKFTAVVDKTYSKLKKKEIENKGVSRNDDVNVSKEGMTIEDKYFSIKAEGVVLAVLKKYIESIIKEIVSVENGNILIHERHKKSIDKIKNGDNFAKFVSQKYKSYKDDLVGVSVYMAIVYTYDNPNKLSGYRKADIDAISKHL